MQVTISLLPSSLSLVHIPRSRISHLSHPILKQVLRPHPTFLNITCNQVELSLFADESVLHDFEPIARKDRRKQRARSNSSSSGRRASQSRKRDAVEVSYERWNVLQVDSHNDQIDNSGARVNEVSAPLAAAGISILYQSSYMSDFILVKESRIQEAMSLLSEAGFEIYSSTDSQSSPINTVHPNNRSSVHDFRPESVMKASMTRARSGTDPSGSKLDSQSVWDVDHKKNDGSTPLSGSGKPQKKSTSPNSGDVHLLPSDLACVGLSEELGADHWGLKIVKLVAFPEMILSPAPPLCVPRISTRDPTFITSLFPVKAPTAPVFDRSPPTSATRGYSTSPTTSVSSTESSNGEDDGYFSHSPQTKSTLSVITSESASRSQADLRDPSVVSPYKHRSRHVIQPFSQIVPPDDVAPVQTVSHPPQDSRIPFFSYTRTTEGSSLTADVFVLAALFPPPERHMIISSGELDAADNRSADRLPLDGIDGILDDVDIPDNVDSDGSILTCLQIDLQRFGLDKYGLVNRFSKVLEQNKINHMYSSTFKTANLLVDKKHARRAQALLCNC